MMEMMYPDLFDSEDSMVGTASHELGESMVRSHAAGGADFPMPDDTIGQMASNGVLITQEMYDGAKMYADAMRDIMVETGVFGGKNLRIEQRVAMPRIHAESWGTPDFALFDSKSLTIYLTDYKFGHRIVEVFECWQLIEYSVGLLDEFTKGGGWVDQQITIVFTIVQPRAFHREGPIRSWTVNASDLRAYVNILTATEAAALGPDPMFCVGSECRDCSGRHVCELLQSSAYDVVEYTGKSTPVELTAPALGRELYTLTQAATLLKARITGLSAQAEGIIHTGQVVPGWKLEAGQGHQKWTVTAVEAIGLGDMLGVDLRKPETPCTPKQAISKGIDASVISGYSETPSTGLRLVPDNGNKAKEVFN